MVPLTEDFFFRTGKVTRGKCKPDFLEISTITLNPVALCRRITLVVVNWSLHLVSEIYRLATVRAGRYSNVDDLPAM